MRFLLPEKNRRKRPENNDSFFHKLIKIGNATRIVFNNTATNIQMADWWSFTLQIFYVLKDIL